MNFYKIKVDQLIKQTKDAITIGFKLEKDHPLRHFSPGQYLTLKYELMGEHFLRCYSISSIPTDEYLNITIKQTKQGFISKELVNKCHIGKELELGVPHGKFKISPFVSKRRSHLFFAAGSGITPIISMIQYLLEEELTSNIYLLYGNRKEEDIIFYQKLNELQVKYEGQLKVIFTLTNPGNKFKIFPFSSNNIQWKGWKGRIGEKLIAQFLEESKDNNKEKEYYLCGPGSFIQQVEKSLLKNTIDPLHIHKEYFNIEVNPSKTQEDTKAVLPECKLTFKLNNQIHTIETKSGEKILDAIVRSGFDPPHSCSSGACATCVAQKVSGEVSMDSSLALDQSEISSGLILTCQSRCLTESVEIAYED